MNDQCITVKTICRPIHLSEKVKSFAQLVCMLLFYTFFYWVLLIPKNQKTTILIKTFIVWPENKRCLYFLHLMNSGPRSSKQKCNEFEQFLFTFIFVYSLGRIQNNKWLTVCRTLFVSKLVMTLFGVLARSCRDCSLFTNNNDEKYPFWQARDQVPSPSQIEKGKRNLDSGLSLKSYGLPPPII